MEAQSVKISWKIMMFPHIVVLIFGLIWTFAPSISVGQDLQSFIGQPWLDFVASNAKLASFISLFGRVLGVQLIIIGILAIAITLTAYRRGEKWSWYVLLAGNTLGWGSGLAMEGITGVIPIVVVQAIILLIAYVGLAISAKAVLTKASS
jgi:hypothetical protein